MDNSCTVLFQYQQPQQQQVMYIDPAYINYQQYPGMIPISTIYRPQSPMIMPLSMSYQQQQQSFVAVIADGQQQTMPTSFGYVVNSDAYMQQQSMAPQLIYQPAVSS